SKYFITGIIVVVIIAPLCAFRRISFLSYTSFLAIVAIAYLVVLVFVKFIQKAVTEGLPTTHFVYFGNFYPGIIMTFPVYFFAFGSHITLLPMYAEFFSLTLQ